MTTDSALKRHQTGTIQSGDVTLFYRHFRGPITGGKTPVIIFHGGNYYDSTDWIDVGQRLAQDRDVLAWDTRGFGQSTWSKSKNYSIDAHLADALALVKHFNWPKVVVMGHSLGGLYTILFASRHRDRTAALTLVDSSPAVLNKALTQTGPTLGLEQTLYATAQDALSKTSREPAISGTPAFDSFAARLRRVDGSYYLPRDPDFVNRAPVGDPNWRTRYVVDDMWREMSAVSNPVLVVYGKRSDRFNEDSLARISNACPGAAIKVVDSGHDVAGGDATALVESVRNFLKNAEL